VVDEGASGVDSVCVREGEQEESGLTRPGECEGKRHACVMSR
jgi:hypothetical protein